jgi:hypothetical protein
VVMEWHGHPQCVRQLLTVYDHATKQPRGAAVVEVSLVSIKAGA